MDWGGGLGVWASKLWRAGGVVDEAVSTKLCWRILVVVVICFFCVICRGVREGGEERKVDRYGKVVGYVWGEVLNWGWTWTGARANGRRTEPEPREMDNHRRFLDLYGGFHHGQSERIPAPALATIFPGI